MTYSEWIVINVMDPVGTCKETTEDMQAAFPELTRVRGHYHCPVWGLRAHWWMIDLDGKIIDPTDEQFPSKGLGVYVAWNEDDLEPTGKCLDCGEYLFDGDIHCNDQCRRAFMADLL